MSSSNDCNVTSTHDKANLIIFVYPMWSIAANGSKFLRYSTHFVIVELQSIGRIQMPDRVVNFVAVFNMHLETAIVQASSFFHSPCLATP